MQHLEVSGAVRPLQSSLGAKRLMSHVRTLVKDLEAVSETVLCLNYYTFTTPKHRTYLVRGARISKYFQ